MPAEFGIVGDSPSVELPEMQVDEAQLSAEKNAAKFSRTKEFQALKTYLETRIKFYQTYLPDGRNILAMDKIDGQDWKLANAIIGELKAVIDSYEVPNRVMTDAAR